MYYYSYCIISYTLNTDKKFGYEYELDLQGFGFDIIQLLY